MTRSLIVVMVCLVVLVACSFELGMRAERAGVGSADIGSATAQLLQWR